MSNPGSVYGAGQPYPPAAQHTAATPSSATPSSTAPPAAAPSSAARYPSAPYATARYPVAPSSAAPYPAGPYLAAPYPGAPYSGVPYSGVPQPPRRRGRAARLALATLVIAAGGGALGAAVTNWQDHPAATASAGSSAAPVTTVVDAPSASSGSLATLVKRIDPVVVSLTVTGAGEEDLGSGIVLTADGSILTNNHVVSAAERGGTVTATFTDGKTVPATIVAADTTDDLAIVKAQGVSGLTTARLADSDSVQVGDTVIAIGNELGLPNSVSEGIVSALHRKVSVASDENTPLRGFGSRGGSTSTTYPNAIQTDASINQGDSGGALFNVSGQVVGIDSAIATASDGSTGSVGIGFAIAINDAKSFISANT